MKQLSTKKSFLSHTKKGAASIYVVVFATILFGVITLSFVSVILSEAGQSSDDDLSRSAYDAALAGVEDAKQAYIKYANDLKCRGGGHAAHETECQILEGGSTGAAGKINMTDCMGLSAFLYSAPTEQEVLISQKTSKDETIDQAYTCVTLSNQNEKFLATLDQSTTTMIVPIANGDDLKKVQSVEFDWFSPDNLADYNADIKENGSDAKLKEAKDAPVPSTITLTLVAAAEDSIKLEDMVSSDYWGQSTMVLLPSSIVSGSDPTPISKTEVTRAAQATKGDSNLPFKVNIDNTASDFLCKVELQLDDYFKDANYAYLIVSNTYNDGLRNDFSVTAKDKDGKPVLNNAQLKVDSTGRANQLVRRVEARINIPDLTFPVPEYALQVDGDGDDDISKSFYITNNCWTEKSTCDNNGDVN